MARFSFSPRHIAASALAAALLTAASIPAMAQTPRMDAAAPVAQTDGGPAAHHKRGPRMTPEQRQERMAQHAAELKQKLRITPEQETAWTAFQSSMQPQQSADGPRPHFDFKAFQQLSTPERLDRMHEWRVKRNAEADRHEAAVRTFYAALQPDQQKVFDQESLRMMHRFGPGEHARGGKHPGKHAPAPASTPAPVQ